MSTLTKNNTAVKYDSNGFSVQLHGTTIVSFHSNASHQTLVLNTGGFNTPTTLRRMNQVFKALLPGTSFRVYKVNNDVYLSNGKETHKFDSGYLLLMEVHA